MNALVARLDAYERLIRLDKPIGILLLLWPTLWALWLARRGIPNYVVLWVFVMGTILMRSAGCAINDFADRRFDAMVERTRSRPLAMHQIAPWEAVAVAAVLSACAFALVWQLNELTVKISVACVAVAALYPFTKRFFWMPQAFLGIAFSMGIVMAYAAIRNHVPPIAWALVAANFFWTLAYDTEYAMVDREDDRRIGIRTSALLFGRYDVAAVMICHAIFLAILVGVGAWQRFGIPYFAGFIAASALVGYQYTLIRGRTREGCFKAFLHNNWIGAAIFAGIVADHAWR